jgi:two-component system sensor histidine kinase DegS
MSGPYTRDQMEAARVEADRRDSQIGGLLSDAGAVVIHGADTIHRILDRYRAAYSDMLGRWRDLRDGSAEKDMLGSDLAAYQGVLSKLELAERTLTRMSRFLERDDATLITESDGPATDDDIAMRIIEAQEAERSRLAQEIHDGPAQALTNAIFRVEYIDRIVASDPAAATTELHALRDLLTRELSGVRDFIYQLRPPLVDELGFDGAMTEVIDHLRGTGLAITTALTTPADALDAGARIAAVRITQEALQNVRKHAGASNVVVRTDRSDDGWTLEIRDDGRGFDVGAAAARGRRSFGLQFMRERAALIGARLDVRSRPDGGTVVRLTVPSDARTGAKEST